MMGSTSRRTEVVIRIARLLDEHRGEDTIALDLGEMNSWTDYFVITTVRSAAHLAGLLGRLEEYFRENDITPLNYNRRAPNDRWTLIDCGYFAVHLMEREIRDFYSLERLYFRGDVLYHSSKSS